MKMISDGADHYWSSILLYGGGRGCPGGATGPLCHRKTWQGIAQESSKGLLWEFDNHQEQTGEEAANRLSAFEKLRDGELPSGYDVGAVYRVTLGEDAYVLRRAVNRDGAPGFAGIQNKHH